MFEKYKAQRAAREYQTSLARWQAQRDGYAQLVEIAENFAGETTDEIMLKPGEALFCRVTNCSLVEERRGPGHFQAGSAGVSIPIGSMGGRSVRWRVGGTRGHYVQGAPAPTAIDTGTVFITNRRVVFAGNNQTRECLYDKTIGIAHDDGAGETTISVSNRQKPTVIHYGPAIADDVDFRLELAIAHFKGTVPQLVKQMRAQLAQIESERPNDPSESARLATLPPPPFPTAPPPRSQYPNVPPPPFPAASPQATPLGGPPRSPYADLPPPPLPAAPPPTPATAQSPPPPPPQGIAVVTPTDHEAGWEYMYFASEIARGIQECQPRYLEYQSQTTSPTGESVVDPGANARALTDELSASVAQVDQVFNPTVLERAFGAPGEPGNEAAIRSAAASICSIYAEMISWGIRVRSFDVDSGWRPVYAALSKCVGLPLHQVQDFSAALSAGVSRVVTHIRSGNESSEPLNLTLTLTIDPNATAEFNAALAAVGQTR
jgi:hypothetical protein